VAGQAHQDFVKIGGEDWGERSEQKLASISTMASSVARCGLLPLGVRELASETPDTRRERRKGIQRLSILHRFSAPSQAALAVWQHAPWGMRSR
jgi:hypothetical protein